MVIPMKKVSIILLSREKETFLKQAQKSGIFQIIKDQEKVDKSLEEKIELLNKVQRTIQELKLEKKKHKKIISKLKPSSENFSKTLHILSELDRLREEFTNYNREIEKLELDKKKLLPWGHFNLNSIEQLNQKGVYAHFYIMSTKGFDAFDTSDLTYEIVHREKKSVYFVVFSRDASKKHDGEIFLPSESLGDIIQKINEKRNVKDALEIKILQFVHYIDALQKFSVELANSIQFIQATLNCNDDEPGKLTQIQAWFSAENEDAVEELLKPFTLWHQISEPEVNEGPPVKLKNNFLIKPFEVITRIFSLPSYFEMDPTPLFAPFFMLFFGLCIADVGYAMVILLVLSIGYFKINESLKPIFRLGIILGAFTLIAGYWLNTFFGFSIYQTPELEDALIARDSSGDFLASYKDQGKMIFPAMTFSLLVGFTQVIFGMILQMINRWKKSGFIYSIMPFSYILQISGLLVLSAHKNIMGFADMKIGNLLIGGSVIKVPFEWSYYLLFAGTILLLFFNNPNKKIWVRPPLALWEFYGFASGIIGDILSYLRLFALGLAGGLLGNAFNNIGFMILHAGPDSVMHILFASFVFLFGHSLNIILSLLGAFVHSLRLTFVEFYKNLQFEGGGKPFTPFTLEK